MGLWSPLVSPLVRTMFCENKTEASNSSTLSLFWHLVFPLLCYTNASTCTATVTNCSTKTFSWLDNMAKLKSLSYFSKQNSFPACFTVSQQSTGGLRKGRFCSIWQVTKSCIWRRTTPSPRMRLIATQLERSFPEKDLWVLLVGTGSKWVSTMSLPQRRHTLGKVLPAGWGTPCLFRTGEATPGVLWLLLSSPRQNIWSYSKQAKKEPQNEHLSHKERLTELGLFWLVKRSIVSGYSHQCI